MTFSDFQNALRKLRSIDKDELVEAGVIDGLDDVAWMEFRSNPFVWMITWASDEQALGVWEIIRREGE